MTLRCIIFYVLASCALGCVKKGDVDSDSRRESGDDPCTLACNAAITEGCVQLVKAFWIPEEILLGNSCNDECRVMGSAPCRDAWADWIECVQDEPVECTNDGYAVFADCDEEENTANTCEMNYSNTILAASFSTREECAEHCSIAIGDGKYSSKLYADAAPCICADCGDVCAAPCASDDFLDSLTLQEDRKDCSACIWGVSECLNDAVRECRTNPDCEDIYECVEVACTQPPAQPSPCAGQANFDACIECCSVEYSGEAAAVEGLYVDCLCAEDQCGSECAEFCADDSDDLTGACLGCAEDAYDGCSDSAWEQCSTARTCRDLGACQDACYGEH